MFQTGADKNSYIRKPGQFEDGASIFVRENRAQTLSYTATNFTLDNEPFRIVSGSVHYFRIAPAQWRSVLQSARAMGLNTISTYVPWNLHEPHANRFVFSGMLDIRAFLELAASEGLLVLLRPGPYICSEWDLGGIPAWTLKGSTNSEVRNGQLLKQAALFFDAVTQQIAPYIGKPIVGLQIENEYGGYGEDASYMEEIRRMWMIRGLSRPKLMLFTSDNGYNNSLTKGSPFSSHEVLKTINMEADIARKIGHLRKVQPDAPVMVGELWSGWFDHWGEAKALLYKHDASFNLYMYAGGTNFGFMNGANVDSAGVYLPTTTSYDYDAFIGEGSHVREEKYYAMQKVIRRFWKQIDTEYYRHIPRIKPQRYALSGFTGPVTLRESAPLLHVVDYISENTFDSRLPVPMEDAGSGYGYILYSHTIDYSLFHDSSHALALKLGPIRDFAIVMCDGIVVATIDRNSEYNSQTHDYRRTKVPYGTNKLDILVENRGHVNYGRGWLFDKKGLLGNLTLGGAPLENFKIHALSLTSDTDLIPAGGDERGIKEIGMILMGRNEHPPLKSRASPPTFFRGTMWIGPNSDDESPMPGTFVRAFGRGVMWINGFCVGRFHTGVRGPQRSLYVPGSVFKEGENEIIVFHQNMFLVRGNPHPVVIYNIEIDARINLMCGFMRVRNFRIWQT